VARSWELCRVRPRLASPGGGLGAGGRGRVYLGARVSLASLPRTPAWHRRAATGDWSSPLAGRGAVATTARRFSPCDRRNPIEAARLLRPARPAAQLP